MIIKGIIFEDFVNYKKPCMTIEFPYCDFKCDRECGTKVCQNSSLVYIDDINISIEYILKSYINNDITEAIVCQGLEPFESWTDVQSLVKEFREVSDDDIVIYTGYNRCEIEDKVRWLKNYKNIIIKYGRFVPDQKLHYDNILGVDLASDNQYAEKIS